MQESWEALSCRMKRLFLFLAFSLLTPFAFAQSVVLTDSNLQRAGLNFHEETTLELEEGKFALQLGENTLAGAAQAFLTDIADRKFLTEDKQIVDVLSSVRTIHFVFGSKSHPKEEPGRLQGKKITGTRSEGHWSYVLASGQKPNDAEAKALKQFAGYTEFTEAFASLYGSTPRQIGETWKPDLSALKKTPSGLEADIECKLDELVEHDGVNCAKLSLHGTLSGTIGESNTVKLGVSGVVFRNLRDFVDADLVLTGTFKYVGAFGGTEGKSNSRANIEAPLSVKRRVIVIHEK